MAVARGQAMHTMRRNPEIALTAARLYLAVLRERLDDSAADPDGLRQTADRLGETIRYLEDVLREIPDRYDA